MGVRGKTSNQAPLPNLIFRVAPAREAGTAGRVAATSQQVAPPGEAPRAFAWKFGILNRMHGDKSTLSM